MQYYHPYHYKRNNNEQFRARNLEFSDLWLEIKGSRFESRQ